MLSIAVVCEGPADQRTGCDLADRIFCNEVEWLDSEALGYQRHWSGFKREEDYLSWAMAKKLAESRHVRSHGFFDEKPTAHDAHTVNIRPTRLFSYPSPPK